MSGSRDLRSLRDTQMWMMAAITGPVADATPESIARYVTEGPRLSASERFDIYRFGYHARLVECLLDDYPVLAAMLGEEHADALCRQYIDRHPSSSPNLNAYGQHMPAFCRDAKVEGCPGFDALRGFAADLATLEWALVEVLHAETAPPLDVRSLQSIAPEAWASARFIRSEALRVLHFDYPVNDVFIANRIDKIVPDVPAPAPNAIAVYRKDMQLWRMTLTPAMVGVLEPLISGQTLGEALASIEADDTKPTILAETSANLMVWFREWVDAGFFTRIDVT